MMKKLSVLVLLLTIAVSLFPAVHAEDQLQFLSSLPGITVVDSVGEGPTMFASPLEIAVMEANKAFCELYPGVSAEDMAKIRIRRVHRTYYMSDSENLPNKATITYIYDGNQLFELDIEVTMDDIRTPEDETSITWHTPYPLADMIDMYHSVPIDKSAAVSIARERYRQILLDMTGTPAYLDFVDRYGADMLDADILICQTGFICYAGYDPFWELYMRHPLDWSPDADEYAGHSWLEFEIDARTGEITYESESCLFSDRLHPFH